MDGRGPVDAVEIRAALGRLVSSVSLRNAPRLTGFLRYVIEYSLSGTPVQLKGYMIAVGALGRSPDFDPVVDPIVRVEATRLRRAMARYYAGEGFADPILIELPLGGYAPVYHHRPAVLPLALAPLVQPSGDDDTLAEMLENMIRSRRAQIRAMLIEMRVAKQSLQRYRALMPGGAACPPPVRLLPPAPSHNAARPADGRQKQQAEGAPAARAG